MPDKGTQPIAVTGVQIAQGVAMPEARSFWAEAWAQVLRRKTAVAAIAWLAVIAFFAAFAPLIASGHPLILREIDADGAVTRTASPLLANLRASDVVLALGTPLALAWIFLPGRSGRARRLGSAIYGGVLAGVIVVGAALVEVTLHRRDAGDWARALRDWPHIHAATPAVLAAIVAAIGILLPAITPIRRRVVVVLVAAVLAAFACAVSWDRPLQVFDYLQRERAGQIEATYTLVPWSPSQRFAELDRLPPGAAFGDSLELPPGSPGASQVFLMGTDAMGQDVLSQILSASRLAISIGLVSTGLAVLIGVTMGSLMGYFGGWVDLILFRVVEIFMAIPVLFLLILTAAVTPPELRSTYVMMAIIGCFTWTGAARFTRAEFLKLRSQDFVQSARVVGLPLSSILFKHMLPNGVTPVLVDASFGIAAAITIEATLSFLGLGPVDQPSWGKLLSNATNTEGEFKWWLAVYPGAAIFLTVLSYNLIGEALRDAIDPKLKKARV